MIDRSHDLPVTRQAAILQLSRSSVYYRARPVSAADLAVMRRIDELHLNYPFAGSRMLRDLLRSEGAAIGRQRTATMMKRIRYRSDLPPAEHVQAGAWAQYLPIFRGTSTG